MCLQLHLYEIICTDSEFVYEFIGICLVQVGNGIGLEAVGLKFEPYWWLPCGVTWDSSLTVVVKKLLRTSALYEFRYMNSHY